MPSLMRLLLSGRITLKSLLSLPEPPKPQISYCSHARCSNGQDISLMVMDDHDSFVDTWTVKGYCSLNCFVCDIKHAWYNRARDGGKSLDAVMKRIK